MTAGCSGTRPRVAPWPFDRFIRPLSSRRFSCLALACSTSHHMVGTLRRGSEHPMTGASHLCYFNKGNFLRRGWIWDRG